MKYGFSINKKIVLAIDLLEQFLHLYAWQDSSKCSSLLENYISKTDCVTKYCTFTSNDLIRNIEETLM